MKVETVTITNGPARACLMTYGASLTELWLEGIDHSLVLGSPDHSAYTDQMRYFGAIVGPVANRIGGATAELDGQTLRFPANEGQNTLHGGQNGLSNRVWHIEDQSPASVRFGITLEDGEDGLPGPLTLRATYTLDKDGTLTVHLEGGSAKPTLCNPAFHGYWCLNGTGLSGHRLTINADHYVPVDGALIPTGEIAPVAGTPYDLRHATALPSAQAFDTNFCLNGSGLRKVACLETDSLAMWVETDAPGLQIYDAARMTTAPVAGHHGAPYGAHAGLAIEPQFWPDAPNHPAFPAIDLRPGQVFSQTSRYSFQRKS